MWTHTYSVCLHVYSYNQTVWLAPFRHQYILYIYICVYIHIYICVGSTRSVQIPHLTPYPIWLPLGVSEQPVASEHATKSSIACPLLCITPGPAAALSYRALPHRGGHPPDRPLGQRPMGGAGGEGRRLGPSSISSSRGGPSGHTCLSQHPSGHPSIQLNPNPHPNPSPPMPIHLPPYQPIPHHPNHIPSRMHGCISLLLDMTCLCLNDTENRCCTMTLANQAFHNLLAHQPPDKKSNNPRHTSHRIAHRLLQSPSVLDSCPQMLQCLV